ncbi:MAG TPA: antibiotic biosynthesis monooxygenase [Ramlibacter sp.]|nr:antibiotic biosynthesis monooxygenase [Ramlibacter sp.]
MTHPAAPSMAAILVTSEVPGQTTEGYDRVLAQVRAAVVNAPGFVLHAAHPDEGCWRVLEVWRSKAEADAFFARHVVPNLPPGIRPKRHYRVLHSLLQPAPGRAESS